MVAAMDAVGVDGAIMVSPNSLYAFDASYAIEVQRAYPGRFAIVKPVNPDDPAVDEIVAEWKKQPGAVAIRVMFALANTTELNKAGIDRILREEARVVLAMANPGERCVLDELEFVTGRRVVPCVALSAPLAPGDLVDRVSRWKSAAVRPDDALATLAADAQHSAALRSRLTEAAGRIRALKTWLTAHGGPSCS